jgi:hypothetical protein
MSGDPNREDIVLEGDPAEKPTEEVVIQRRLIVVEGQKYPNTDAIPTQPLRCIRDA